MSDNSTPGHDDFDGRLEPEGDDNDHLAQWEDDQVDDEREYWEHYFEEDEEDRRRPRKFKERGKFRNREF